MYKYTVIIYHKSVRLLKITIPYLNVEKYTFVMITTDLIKVFPVYRQKDFFTSLRVSLIMYKVWLNNQLLYITLNIISKWTYS